MDKQSIENLKLLALPGTIFGVSYWVILMMLNPIILCLTLGAGLAFITIDRYNELKNFTN